MRYLKTLLVALLSFVVSASYADGDFIGSEVAPGTYYLYNVGAKKFLVPGNSWGTQASFGPNATMDVKIAALGEGLYSINGGLANGATDIYIGHANGSEGIFCDQPVGRGNWEFVDAQILGAYAYYLRLKSDYNKYLVYDGSSTVASLSNTLDKNAIWLLLTKDELLAELQKADADNGVDATFLISGPNFGRNDQNRNSVWVATANNISYGANDKGRGANNNFCAESWCSAFDLHQDLSDVPSGDYKMNVQAAITEYNVTGQNLAYAYANEATSTFVPMTEGENSMTMMSNSFTGGKYELDPVNVNVAEGSLRVGVKGTRTDTWCCWDNFRLTFYGPGNNAGAKSLFDEIEDFMQVPFALDDLKTLIEKCEAGIDEVDPSMVTELQDAINAAKGVYENSIDLATIQDAYANLDRVYKKAYALTVAKEQAAEVLNDVPAQLFPKDFWWDGEYKLVAKKDKDGNEVKDKNGNVVYEKVALDKVETMDLHRQFKIYKNNNGKYQLASRIAVATLIRLLQWADADVKTREMLDDKLAALGADSYETSEALTQMLTQYSRLVVESHGVGAALQEQKDPNYARMYDAINQTGLADDAFLEFLIATAPSTSIRYTAFDPSEGSWLDNRTWVSDDGVLTAELLTNDYDIPDTDWPSYLGFQPGDEVKFTIPDGTFFEGMEYDMDVNVMNIDGTEVTDYATLYFDGKKTEVIATCVDFPNYSYGAGFYPIVNDPRTPWEKAGIEYTLSDVYEMLHYYMDTYLWRIDGSNYLGYDYHGFNPYYTAHIADPDLNEGGRAWNNNGWNIGGGEELVDAFGNNEYPYFDMNSWAPNDKGFDVDANQTINLPAGRYMLTVAGRASAAKKYETNVEIDGKQFKGGHIYDGPFTEASAADPDNYFQIYATVSNTGKTTAASLVPQIGNEDGIFTHGWNDASVFFTMPSDGLVTLGVRAGTNQANRWVSATRFRLTRLGDCTLYFDENQSYDAELNWDPVNFFFATAPTDVVLHKNMKAGKWQSIALPVDVSGEQLAAVFGDGTELAVPTDIYMHDQDAKELAVNFTSWSVTGNSTGLVSTKVYGDEYYDLYGGYGYWYNFADFGGYAYDNPTGMIANVPYLIKPAKVDASNLYVFHDVKSSETHGSKEFTTEDGIWSWGSFRYTFGDEDIDPGFYADVEGDEEFVNYFGQIEFVPNYTYSPNIAEDFTVEFSDRSKAFGAKFVCPEDWKVVAAFINETDEIVQDELADMIELGQSRQDWYPGIPSALLKAIATNPKVEGANEENYYLKSYDNGVIADDEMSWNTPDGRLSIVAEGDDAFIYNWQNFVNHFKHESNQTSVIVLDNDYYLTPEFTSSLMFGPGKYTVKANKENEYPYANIFVYSARWGDVKLTLDDGSELELPNTSGVWDLASNIQDVSSGFPESQVKTFTVEGGVFEVPIYAFYMVYGKNQYSEDEFYLIVDALKNAKKAHAEAQKAVEPSKEFHALMTEAQDLLNNPHDELVEGADNQFKTLLAGYNRRFDQLLTAEAVKDLAERLRKAVEEFKLKIAPKIEVGNIVAINVASGKYLGGGNSWGTRASLVEIGDLFTLARLENGKYTLETRFTNGGESYFLGPNYFVDNSNKLELTIESAGEELYTLACEGESGFGYLGWDGTESTEVKVLADKSDKGAVWKLVNVDDVQPFVDAATMENPVDVSFVILDHNFGRNGRDRGAWEGYVKDTEGKDKEGDIFGYGGGDHVNNNAERWGGNTGEFDGHQFITLPNGVYALNFNGYYRYNNTTDNTNQVAIDAHKAGTEVINSFVYANDEEVPFLSIADEKAVAELGEDGLPFSQGAAAEAFAKGLYKNVLVFEVTDGTLKLGVKKVAHEGCDWTVWDNFQLFAYGADVALDDVKALFVKAGGESTGINDINAAQGETVIYTIDGVRVNSMLKKGVYVVNGKKVTVK